MEPGECSGVATPIEEEPWAKLVSLDPNHPDIEIGLDEMVICSETMCSSLDNQDWCKITRNSDLGSATLQNISFNTIIVDGAILEKEETGLIKCGTEIISGPENEEYKRYRFKLMRTSEHCKKQLKISLDVAHAKCKICSNVWNDVVTVAPCLHNFCNGCFSEWSRSQGEHTTVLCPQCGAVVHCVERNQFLHRIELEILESDASLKRPNEDTLLIEPRASTNLDLIVSTGIRTGKRSGNKTGNRILGWKRPYSPKDEENKGIELPCPQCGTKFGQFQCHQTTGHIQCQACSGMMPSRPNNPVPQHCLGCGGTFCWAYWQAQGVLKSGTHTICSHDNFKRISDHTISKIPIFAHQNNQIEQNITEWCIEKMGKTLQDVISDWIIKLNNREIDRTRMPLNHAEMITVETYLCNGCFGELVSYLLYWFRVTTPKDLLPPESSTREKCWYGYACHTQHNNEEHARKRNHVCRPIRGKNVQ